MLFNSPEFLFFFLPLVLTLALWAKNTSRDLLVVTLLAFSILFYYAGAAGLTLVLLVSVIVNFIFAKGIARFPSSSGTLLFLGIAFNLTLLCHFKYATFLVGELANIGVDIHWSNDAILPIGISFYTFQQIAYLVDIHRRESVDTSFLRYFLFVSFFPQLIAGPIVHHREMMPQFAQPQQEMWSDLSAGLSIFIIGLFKKVAIADALSPTVAASFGMAENGGEIGAAVAWYAAMAFALQIYFDFSGYSDMAVGLGRMFGIHLPINFASPYKADSIDDFWRRWHVTLSRFLRDYLYIPLGGNRLTRHRRIVNVLVTMLLGGVWHGAGWTFLLWGALHGAFITVHILWRGTSLRVAFIRIFGTGWAAFARAATLLAVLVAWVPFRASGISPTMEIWLAMIGMNGLQPAQLTSVGIGTRQISGMAIAWAIALFAPNAYQLLASYRLGTPSPGYPSTSIADAPKWVQPIIGTWSHALILGALFFVIFIQLNDPSEFLYFDF